MAATLGAQPVGDIPPAFEEEFRKRVMVTDSCHVWTGSCLVSGHGEMSRHKQNGTYAQITAHRVAYALAYGDPGEMIVRHKCDNPWCVAPYHLELGYAEDNVRDAFERGQLSAKGTRNPIHWAGKGVLNETKVHEARRLKRSGMSNLEVAKSMGVNRRTIADVLNGVSWAYVADERV